MSSIEGDISTRVREVIEARTSEKGRVKELERLTGISASSWKNFLNGQQKATISMAEKLSHAFPELAFWIATGISDDHYGHVTPKWFSTFHSNGKTSASSVKYFQEELAPLPKELAHIEKGLEVLAEFEIITASQNDPTAKTKRSAFLKQLRWLHIFLDEYLMYLGIDTAIAAFNDMRGEAQAMGEKAIQLNETNAYGELLNHFAEKKEEMDKWISRFNKDIKDRAKKQITAPHSHGNNKG